MFVILDLEWYEDQRKRTCPTQLSAVRIDERWQTTEAFHTLIAPQEKYNAPWDHVAFSGDTKAYYLYAPSAYAVLQRLENWLRPDDVLCWWADEPPKMLAKLMRIILKRELMQTTCVLKPYFLHYTPLKGVAHHTPYALLRQLGVEPPSPEHCSRNDVWVVQKLMNSLRMPVDILHQPPPKPPLPPPPLFFFDPATHLLHAPGSDCIRSTTGLIRMDSMRRCISKKYRPCPECCKEIWKQQLRKHNKTRVSTLRYNYFFFEHSSAFHLGNCRVVLSTSSTICGAANYETCIKHGLQPCKICNPQPYQKTRKINHKLTAGQKKALKRYQQARNERASVDTTNMTPAQRKDLQTLTAADNAFWAGAGYGTFHLRSCRKLNGMTELRGFTTYHQAVSAGYAPCRECKPSPKHDLKISMSRHTAKRAGETVDEILSICQKLQLQYSYDHPLLYIHTSRADWEIDVTQNPVIIHHRPFPEEEYHQQHRMFLSLKDAVEYIIRHDNHETPSLLMMLKAQRRKD